MLGTTNFIALVGGGTTPKWDPDSVVIWEASKSKALCRLVLGCKVLNVKLTNEKY